MFADDFKLYASVLSSDTIAGLMKTSIDWVNSALPMCVFKQDSVVSRKRFERTEHDIPYYVFRIDC